MIRNGMLCLALWLICGLTAQGTDRESAAFLAASASITTAEVTRFIDDLASDTFEGRQGGSRGGHAAAGYIVERLRQLKVKPGAGNSYFQPFDAQHRNILAVVPGSDPELKHEYILVGAHYDHVGYGNRSNSYGPIGYIHNGADDNASGTAGVLEVAEALSMLDGHLRRSVLLAWWDGEEEGLLGSKHWISQPTVPLAKVRTAINIDMIGRLRNRRVEVFGSRTSWGLRQLVSECNTDNALLLKFDWEMKENSDHYSFYTAGIPVLMLHTGLHDDYHRPSDDSDKVNHEGVRDVSRLLLAMVWELANREELSGFRTQARSESPAVQRQVERPLPPLPGRLGITWNPVDRQEAGIVVTGVTIGSAADRAGLRQADRIVRFGKEDITAETDIKRLVMTAPASTTVMVRRAGNPDPLTLPVQLAGNPVRVGIAWHEDEAAPGTVLVTRVVPGSPADIAGVKVLDRIYEVGGQPFAGSEEFQTLIVGLASPIELLVERQGCLTRLNLERLD